MYVIFELKERANKYYIDPLSLSFSDEVPTEVDFYVKDSDYPELFIPDEASLAETYYSPKVWGFPQWRFDPVRYDAGKNPFIKFDPMQDEYFLSAIRREHINDQIENIANISTELKTARILINQLFTILIDASLITEMPDDLIEWNNLIADIIAINPKDYTDPQLRERDDSIVRSAEINSTLDTVTELPIAASKAASNEISKLRRRAARKGYGLVKSRKIVEDRTQRRKDVKAKRSDKRTE